MKAYPIILCVLLAGCYTTVGTTKKEARSVAAPGDTLSAPVDPGKASGLGRAVILGFGMAGREGEPWGLLGAGYALRWRFLFASASVDAALRGAESDRYYMDTFSNGQSRCRDSQTGRFASAANCSETETITGYGLDAGLIFANPDAYGSFFVGAGYRPVGGEGPYGSVGYVWPGDPIGGVVRAEAGPNIWQVSAGLLIGRF